jgi:hypothetical protein
MALNRAAAAQYCVRLADLVGWGMVSRVERWLGQSFREALDRNPVQLFEALLAEVESEFVRPASMAIELTRYLGRLGVERAAFFGMEAPFLTIDRSLESQLRSFLNDYSNMRQSLGMTEHSESPDSERG